MTMHIMGIKETSLLSFHVIWIEMLILIICFYKGVYLDLFCLLSLPLNESCFLFIAVHVLWVAIYLCVLNLIYFCGTLQLFKSDFKMGFQDIKCPLCIVGSHTDLLPPQPTRSKTIFTYVWLSHGIWYHNISFLEVERFSFFIAYLIFF